jgi:hypothetical protein
LSFEFDYRVLSRRLRIKYICGSETLDNKKWHLALQMPTSEMTHAEREGENTSVK